LIQLNFLITLDIVGKIGYSQYLQTNYVHFSIVVQESKTDHPNLHPKNLLLRGSNYILSKALTISWFSLAKIRFSIKKNPLLVISFPFNSNKDLHFSKVCHIIRNFSYFFWIFFSTNCSCHIHIFQTIPTMFDHQFSLNQRFFLL